MKLVAIALLILVVIWSGSLAYLAYTAPQPDVRLVAGHLRACPGTSNCVSSESRDPASYIEPLRYKGSAEMAWAALKEAIEKTGGIIVADHDGFLWATYTSRIFRFVDDVECRLVAEEGMIHVRSGSRVGESDMGVNRKRVERLRALFQQQQGGSARIG